MSTLRYHGVAAHVGKTPLIRLRRLSELTGCEILGKAEFMNPGGSVKDRAALGIITEAEASGRLRPGSTINVGDSYAEGIGQMRVTKNLEGIQVDQAYRIEDQLALSIVYQLLREEGLFLGLSSGINLAGALRFAKERGPGQTIVTILCDSGLKYQSKLFNAQWLAAHGLDPNRTIDTALG